LNKRKGYRRGYPVAILVGLEAEKAVLWNVFSQVIKSEKIVSVGNRNDSKSVYSFHESIVNAMRSTVREGIRSIIVVSPARTNYAQKFISHINSHHTWLVRGRSKVALSVLTGSAVTLSEVTSLAKAPAFQKLISETVSEESENLVEVLEQRLNAPTQKTLVLYSLEEIEDFVLASNQTNRTRPEYLLLTDKFLAESRQKNRLHRLMQIAANRGVKTRIISGESKAGLRLAQLGGIVSLAVLP
jgi:stalled ribosome rescue protein Dom34